MDRDRIGHLTGMQTTMRVATAVDGTVVDIIPSQQTGVLLDHVNGLTAKPLRSFDAADMSAFLRNTSMPKLTTLVVNHEVPTHIPGTPIFPFPMFNLPSDKFPSLSSIKMTYAAVHFLPSMASQLRVLHINSSVIGFSLGLFLAPFLECLSGFPHIEELCLTRCFAPPAVNPSAPEGVLASVRRPLNASRLQNLRIEDYPSNIGRIMHELIVPTSAMVLLSGIVCGASPEECGWAFQAMLPHDRTRLPILQFCKAIEVAVYRHGCQVDALMREGDISGSPQFPSSSRLLLRLYTDICDIAHNLNTPWDARLSLFSTVLSGLKHMFQDTRNVTFFKVCGPDGFESIEEDVWADTLVRFPNLRHLVAEDEERMEFPEPLLDALGIPEGLSEITAPLLCPNLDSLELGGGDISGVVDSDSDSDIDTEDSDTDTEDTNTENTNAENTDTEDTDTEGGGVAQLDHIIACLASRREHGGLTTLRNLKVEISSRVAVPEQVLARYRREFYRLAINYSLEAKLLE
ncbi:hypothetical protein TRAPUB_10579 [Trametes pubescens]|uniref:Uncharacterized protein n=1 Tax=Trametes pubescens TaxID=154538 RepID=A0A1M2VZE0_TRAPU|nr:hypothetical protein TRAPUB_10579 [Trametes pubescens]